MFQTKDIIDRFDKVILSQMIIDVVKLRTFLFIEVHVVDVFRY